MVKVVKVIAVLFVFALIGVEANAQNKVVVIPLGGDDISGHNFTGPQVNLPVKVAEAAGFKVCHIEEYGETGNFTTLANTVCDKQELMLACRPAGSDVLQLAAHAHRNDVLQLTSKHVAHSANGSNWYRNIFSTGFAHDNALISQLSADVWDRDNSSLQATRLSWHGGNPSFTTGWRCGANTNIYGSSYERIILHR